MDRVKVFLGHLNQQNYQEDVQVIEQYTSSGGKHLDSDDDIVIVSALRTPICKSKRGGLKDKKTPYIITEEPVICCLESMHVIWVKEDGKILSNESNITTQPEWPSDKTNIAVTSQVKDVEPLPSDEYRHLSM